MVHAIQKPGIHIMQTPKGLLAKGYLPGVTQLDVDIQDEAVYFSGESMQGEFLEEFAIPKPIDKENSITAFHDEQLRMVIPWRIKR